MEIISNYNSKVCYGYKKTFVYEKLKVKLMLAEMSFVMFDINTSCS